MLTLAAVLLHAATFGGLDWAWPAPEPLPLPTAVTMQTRSIDPMPAKLLEITPVVDVAPVPAPFRKLVDRSEPRRQAAAKTARGASSEPAPMAVDPSAAPAVVTEEATPLPVMLAQASAVPDAPAASAPAPAADETLPHYRTHPPPALTMRYDLKRGMLNGNGELTWQPQGDHYDMKLAGRVGSLAVLTQTSNGGLDASGLAPLRFTDQRMARATTAVNFQRAAGKITFSGPSTEYPMHDGVQDRLSWMIQLSSIVAAEPKLRVAGAKVGMWVIGSHGEAGIWMFRCIGPETIATPGGSVESIKYMRDPRDTYDATVQVWVDPQRFYLPVRASQQSGPKDDPFELRVQSVTTTT